MASSDTLEFETLLAPISEDQPTGVELRSDVALRVEFYQVRDAAKVARDAERRAREYALFSEEDRQYETAPDSPDWQGVRKAAIKLIATKSKDLWLAAWLIEASARTDGFAGLRDGFRVVRQLCEQYWDDIHPVPDKDDGVEFTVSQLSGLNEILGIVSDEIAITPETDSLPALSSADYKDAIELEKPAAAGRRAEHRERGGATQETFEKAVSSGPPEFFVNLYEDVNQALEELATMQQVTEEKCGEDEDGYSMAPVTSGIARALNDCRDRIYAIAKHIVAPEGDVAAGDGQVVPSGDVASVVRTREDAFQLLLRVADFFRTSEPHSPVSYSLEQAVRWGRMSLPELMNELIHDRSVKEELARRTGIPIQNSEESD